MSPRPDRYPSAKYSQCKASAFKNLQLILKPIKSYGQLPGEGLKRNRPLTEILANTGKLRVIYPRFENEEMLWLLGRLLAGHICNSYPNFSFLIRKNMYTV